MDSSKSATSNATPKVDSATLEFNKAKPKSPESKRIIACDVGLKRIGVAIYLQGIALPLPAILRKNRNQAARDLSNLLREQNADMLIVGLPISEKAQKIERVEEIENAESSANTSAPQKPESKSADSVEKDSVEVDFAKKIFAKEADSGKVDFMEAAFIKADFAKVDSKKADSKEMDFAKEADSGKIDSAKIESAQDEREAMVRRIRHFVSLLEFEKPIIYIDEGYSSHIASEQLAHLAREDKARAHKDGRIDSLAACEILLRYISHRAKSAQ